MKPAIGGLLVGAIGFFFPNVLGMGYGWVQRALTDDLPMRTAVGLLVLKVIATGLTIGSGGSGGVFAPSVVLGGLLGAVLGNVFHALAPSMVPLPAAFILVGMAAFFAGAAKVPVSSLVMLSEMTTGYGLLVPLMLANAISFLLTPRRVSIYEQQVNSRAESGAHANEFFFDVLKRLRVGDVMGHSGKPVVFGRDMPLAEMLDTVGSGLQPIYPVVNPDGTVYGIIDLGEMRALLGLPFPVTGVVVAEDLCDAGGRVLQADDSLAMALRTLRGTLVEALPVVASNGSGPLVGVLSRRDISNAYHDYLYHASHDGRPPGRAAEILSGN